VFLVNLKDSILKIWKRNNKFSKLSRKSFKKEIQNKATWPVYESKKVNWDMTSGVVDGETWGTTVSYFFWEGERVSPLKKTFFSQKSLSPIFTVSCSCKSLKKGRWPKKGHHLFHRKLQKSEPARRSPTIFVGIHHWIRQWTTFRSPSTLSPQWENGFFLNSM